MRKNTPAKKGFSPFKENKNSSSNKSTPRNASDRKRGDDDKARPGRGDAKRSERPFQSDRKRGDDENGRPGRNDAKRTERPFQSDRKRGDDENGRPGRNDAKRTERPFQSDRKRGDDENGRPAKRTEGRPERSFSSDRKPKDGDTFRPGNKAGGKPERSFPTNRKGKDEETPRSRPARSTDPSEIPGTKRTERDKTARRPRIEPVRKTANGRTPFKRPQSDDSAFHGPSERKAGKRGSSREERPTPSGFNRKKYFDSTNERFADKQDRKSAVRKARHSEDSAPFSKKQSKKEESGNNTGEMPLNKYIAHSGLCSRRKAVDFVKEGKVTVNGKLVTEPAFKVTAKDDVAISNKRISIQKNLVYILLNKPKGYITTTDDPEGRKTVMELIEDAVTDDQRVYPVGRLDRNTSGLLLLTNDGELAQKLAHPKHNIKKIYHVGLNKPLTKADFERILQGVTLEDGIANVDALGYVETGDKTQVGIEIHSGKNRIVRRIFEHLEYDVEKLDRVTYAGLTKKNINRGKWRFLTEKEIILLKHFK
ncbi:pseudouridine synthase [Chitinophaga sp. CF418]|uniref:pseudouridine synthase n=1 Tax=Chitinophaga sp. CF418 TaxID=1855287 RepID=UPI00090F2575|nr:pseudouridine synthase [Chitinophaga sp. CF418]SHN42917.1 23S rRNA pseudouridine2605 synthase [Chitinophaga sp. CF418]